MRTAAKRSRLALVLPALVLLALCWLPACQQRPTGLNPVTGKVSFKGMHLQDGVILFAPDLDRGERGPVCVGTIGLDGSYTLACGDGPGARAGWYRVAIGLPSDTLVPALYRDPERSKLSCEVKADRTNQLDFNLD